MKLQRITPEMVGEDTYQHVEACIAQNVRRMQGYNWYNAGRTVGVAPGFFEMRDYGRECALAYLTQGTPFNDAIQQGTRHAYDRAYGDISGYIRNTGSKREGTVAVTSLTNTFTTHFYHDDYRWFEVCDMIASLPFPDMDKEMLVLYAAGWTHNEVAKHAGINRTTAVMRAKRIGERIRIWADARSSSSATSWKTLTTGVTS